MPKYLLKMEAVNLSSFIEDTQDLSTSRGGSLLLLNSTKRINEHFPKLKKIQTGASEGLFVFESEDKRKAQDLCQQIKDVIGKDPELGQATFILDYFPYDGNNFLFSQEAVTARARWNQFQQSTVVILEINQDNDIHECALDWIRPGTKKETIKKEDKNVSESIYVRRKYGKSQKHKFYKNLLQENNLQEIEAEFVNDFEALTNAPEKGNLHHKMAAIYFDGNRFGQIRNQICRDEQTLNDFDNCLKTYQAEAMRSLLEKMENDKGYRTKDDKLRLETLLWGGDEIIWVVPAWKGWNVMQGFYRISQDWTFGDNYLTHAGGMVFCHHNAPIHRIKHICKELAESAKQQSREKNLFQYLVLESFDNVGPDLQLYRKQQCPFSWECSLLGQDMEEISRSIRKIKSEFPRGQIYKALQAAISSAKASDVEEDNSYDKFQDRLISVLPKEAFDYITSLLASGMLGTSPGFWLHLADLWDYIPEENEL